MCHYELQIKALKSLPPRQRHLSRLLSPFSVTSSLIVICCLLLSPPKEINLLVNIFYSVKSILSLCGKQHRNWSHVAFVKTATNSRLSQTQPASKKPRRMITWRAESHDFVRFAGPIGSGTGFLRDGSRRPNRRGCD